MFESMWVPTLSTRFVITLVIESMANAFVLNKDRCQYHESDEVMNSKAREYT